MCYFDALLLDSFEGMIRLTEGLDVEASAARASAEVFSPLGTLVSLNFLNCWVSSLTNSK